MRCLDCGSTMKVGRENFKYDASGLSGITLNNVEVRRCPGCGDFEVVIPHLEDLHRTIAHTVAQRVERLEAEQVVFLRKYLGWDAATFARRIGVEPETVSRWENGHWVIGPQAERLLRLMVLFATKPRPDYSLDEFEDVATGAPTPFRARFVATSTHEWAAA